MFDKEIGLISAFLLGISVFHIFYCQQIRHFSFIAFLVMVSVYYILKFEKENRIIYLINLTVINILIIYTHPYGFSIILFEWIYGIYALRRNSLRNWFFAQSILSLFIIWWLFLPNKTHIKELIWWIPKPNFSSFLETFNTFTWGGPRYGLDDLEITIKWLSLANLLSLIYLVLCILGLAINKNKEDKNKIFFLFLWLTVPIFMSFLLSRISKLSFFSIKHFFIVIPSFYIILAKGISIFKRNLKIIILTVIFLLNLIPLAIMYNNYFDTDWKKSIEYVRRSIKKDEVIVISSLEEVVPFMYYFSKYKPSLQDIDIYGKINKGRYETSFLSDNHILIIGIEQTGVGGRNITTKEDFERKVLNNRFLKNKSIWCMISRRIDPDEKNFIFDYFDKNFRRVKCKNFQGVGVCYFSSLNSNLN